jgi:glutamyl-tRNA synthetase
MNTPSSVRVRFAPSPTGHLHIGGLRTAFFNWLFARHYQGTFLLRVEDTDLERSKKEYIDSQLASLHWAGLMPDEPIVIQTNRFAEHTAVIQKLLEEKKAYRCYCPHIKQEDFQDGEPFYRKYDRTCRTKTLLQDSTEPYVVRFAIPDGIERVEFNDRIRGHVSFPVEELDDFVIARPDGRPIYNFVVVVDDAFMRITHVIRGEDHISNTPKQILLYQACGYQVPEFAHLPMILGPTGQRLSKRDAATSVLDYKSNGYLPEALLNYLVRLGWAHGDQELFTRQELITHFSLDHVGKKGAIFDPNKLDWVNSMYMRAMDDAQIVRYADDNLDAALVQQLKVWNNHQLATLTKLYKERTKTVRELIIDIIGLSQPPTQYNHEDVAKWTDASTAGYISELIQILEATPDFTVHMLSEAINSYAQRIGIKLVTIAQPIRLALVGRASSPGVFDLLAVVGKQESIRRLRIFAQRVLTAA